MTLEMNMEALHELLALRSVVIPRGVDAVSIQQVIVTESLVGAGTEGNPARTLRQYWDFGGTLLWQVDTVLHVGKGATGP